MEEIQKRTKIMIWSQEKSGGGLLGDETMQAEVKMSVAVKAEAKGEET